MSNPIMRPCMGCSLLLLLLWKHRAAIEHMIPSLRPLGRVPPCLHACNPQTLARTPLADKLRQQRRTLHGHPAAAPSPPLPPPPRCAGTP